MQLEKQVVSLELARRLKELGVRQESLFSWLYADVRSGDMWYVDLTDKEHMIELPEYSAFTVAELGKLLPKKVIWKKRKTPFFLSISWDYVSNKWRYSYANQKANECIEMFFEETEADARAKTLIYLLENKLITLN